MVEKSSRSGSRGSSARARWNNDSKDVLTSASEGQRYMVLDEAMRQELLVLAALEAEAEYQPLAKGTSNKRTDNEAIGAPGRSSIRDKLRKKLFKDTPMRDGVEPVDSAIKPGTRGSLGPGKKKISPLKSAALMKTLSTKDIVGSLLPTEPMMLRVDSGDAKENPELLRLQTAGAVPLTRSSTKQQQQPPKHQLAITVPVRHGNGRVQQMRCVSDSTAQQRRSVSDLNAEQKSDSGEEQKSNSTPTTEATEEIILRLARQARKGISNGYTIEQHMQHLQQQQRKRPILNHIKLHIYDLIPNEMLIQFPFGCLFPIGKCFGALNSSLHSMGTGVYHVGIEVNGIEYAYGACDSPRTTGVFTCVPMRSPGYQYRTTIDFGKRSCIQKCRVHLSHENGTKTQTATSGSGKPPSPEFVEVEQYMDGREIIKQMAAEYMGVDYDLLRKNCCTFASDAAVRLGVPEEEVPSWFRNLAESGAMTQDAAMSTVEPINQIMSTCEADALSQPFGYMDRTCDGDSFARHFPPLQISDWSNDCSPTSCPPEASNIEDGFEVVPSRDRSGDKADCLDNLRDILTVIEAVESDEHMGNNKSETPCQRAVTWTY